MFEPTGSDNQIVSNNVNPTPSTEGVTNPAPASTEPVSTPAPSQIPAERGSLSDWLTARLAGNQQPTNTNPIEPTPQTTPAANPAPAPGQQEPPKTEPAPTAPQTPVIEIPDKFKGPDGTLDVEKFMKSYTNMESMYGKQVKQLDLIPELQQTIIALQQQIAAVNQAKTDPAQPQLTPEELQAKQEADAEAFFENFNKNPLQALKQMINETVNPALEPFRKQQEFQQQVNAWDAQVAKVSSENEDFYDHLPAIQELSKKYGDVLSTRDDAIEVLYNMAKAQNTNAAPTAPAPTEPVTKIPTVDELLNDKELVAQLTQNPAVRNMIIQQHMQDIKNNPMPPVIGTKPGGQPPSSEPVNLKDPKTAKEALKAKYAGVTLT
jgi:hypothetical protein